MKRFSTIYCKEEIKTSLLFPFPYIENVFRNTQQFPRHLTPQTPLHESTPWQTAESFLWERGRRSERKHEKENPTKRNEKRTERGSSKETWRERRREGDLKEDLNEKTHERPQRDSEREKRRESLRWNPKKWIKKLVYYFIFRVFLDVFRSHTQHSPISKHTLILQSSSTQTTPNTYTHIHFSKVKHITHSKSLSTQATP